MNIIKTIILDFDGVIVESNSIKHQAFSKIFSEYPVFYEDIMKYHYSHNATDRYRKFKHIMENIMKISYDDSLFKEWSKKFKKLTMIEIIKCPFVPGAKDFLEYFSRVIELHLASATPIGDLSFILEKRRLLHYFSSVNGSDRPKYEIFQHIAESNHLHPKEILYIGDSSEDLKTAERFGCFFIGRETTYDFKSLGIISFNNMFEIKEHIIKNFRFL